MNKEFLIKFYSQYKMYIFPGVVVLSSLFLIVFAIYPQASKLISNQKTESSLLSRSKFLETKAAELATYDKNDLKRKVGYALIAYPSDKDFGSSVGLLQNLGVQAGFNVRSITLGGGGSKSAQESYPIKMEISGPKSLLPVLISNIESSNRLMRVNSLEATGRDNDVVNAILVVDVLFSPVPNSFGSLDSPLPKISQAEEEVLVSLARNTPELILPTEENTTPVARGKSNPFE